MPKPDPPKPDSVPSDALEFIKNPRSLEEALKCKHLEQLVQIPVEQRDVPSNVKVRGFHHSVFRENVLIDFPAIKMACSCEEYFNVVAAGIPPGTTVAIGKKMLKLDGPHICMVCRYWEKSVLGKGGE